jgi:RNA polymerase sigma factor (sigma-70 family)
MEMARQGQNIIQAISDYGSRLFGFIRSRVDTEEDAEDILQDVWYQLSSQAKLEDIESISGWLYRVAKNKITDSYRKKRTTRLNEEDEDWLPDWVATISNSSEARLFEKLFRKTMMDALSELPEAQRNVFIWNELEEITLQEIASREKENIKTIISRKQYAVKHLRKRLEFLYQDFLNE